MGGLVRGADDGNFKKNLLFLFWFRKLNGIRKYRQWKQ